jgi:hypothetical protein
VDDHRLSKLLIQTDAAIAPPRGGDLIGGAIRRRSRRRRNAAAGAVGTSLLAMIVAIHLARPAITLSPDTPGEGRGEGTPKYDDAAMAIQLDVATRTVDGLLRDEREQAVDQHFQRLEEERMILRQEREEAASSALASAADLTDGDQAAVLRRIVQCYSGTGAAIVAQERLSTIQ